MRGKERASLFRLLWCLYQTGWHKNTTSSWRCRVAPATGCPAAMHRNTLQREEKSDEGEENDYVGFLRVRFRWAAQGGALCWSPFIRISSLGTVWNSLWYWELYLLTVWEERRLFSHHVRGARWVSQHQPLHRPLVVPELLMLRALLLGEPGEQCVAPYNMGANFNTHAVGSDLACSVVFGQEATRYHY